MNDDASPASGNRWEPSDQPAHAASPAGSPLEPVAEPAARAAWLSRARAVVAGGAAAVLLAGGLGGFAVGRATAGGSDDRVDQQGGPAGFDQDGDGRDVGPAPGSGQFPDSRGDDDGRQELNGTDSQDS